MTRLLIVLLVTVFASCFASAKVIAPHIQKLVDQVEAQRYDPESKYFVNINNKDYFIGNEIQLNWFDAIEFCNALAGPLSLVSLETAEENDAIKTYLNSISSGDEFWTSAQRVPGGFIWTGSGQLGTFFDWAAGQPDLGTNNVCVQVTTNGWGDENCAPTQRSFICE